MGAEPGRPNELSLITRIDTARVRPVQSAAGQSFVEPGSPWQNPFVESFGSRVRDEVLSVEAFDSVLWRTIYNHRRPHGHRRPHSSLGWRPPAAYAASLTTNKSEKPARLSWRPDRTNGGAGQIRRRIAAGRALTPTVEVSAHSEHATHRPACSHPACAFPGKSRLSASGPGFSSCLDAAAAGLAITPRPGWSVRDGWRHQLVGVVQGTSSGGSLAEIRTLVHVAALKTAEPARACRV